MADGWILRVTVRTVLGEDTVHDEPLTVEGDDVVPPAIARMSTMNRQLVAGRPVHVYGPRLAYYQPDKVVSLTFDLRSPSATSAEIASVMIQIAAPQTDT